MLTPLLVAGYGRSGTTLLMQMLTAARGVACDRVYPYENRYLTYYAKLARILAAPSPRPELSALQLYNYDDLHFGAMPWPANREREERLGVGGGELFRLAWQALSARASGASHYAEKAPPWLPAWLRPRMATVTLHLVRDPRDLYLSAVAFLRSQGLAQGFGREPASGEVDHARNLAHAMLLYYENERAERGRDDVIRVRYEDLVAERAGIAARLRAMTGLEFPHAMPHEDLPRHRTSASAEASIGRWRREPLPCGVREELESLLGELLGDNAYEPASTAPAPSLPLASQLSQRANAGWSLSGDGVGVEIARPSFWAQELGAGLAAESVTEIWACVRGATGDCAVLRWRGSPARFDEAHSARVAFVPGDHWQILRFVLRGHPAWQGPIAQLRLDLFQGALPEEPGAAVRWIRAVK